MNNTLFYVIFGAIVVYGIYYLVLNNNEGRKRKVEWYTLSRVDKHPKI